MGIVAQENRILLLKPCAKQGSALALKMLLSEHPSLLLVEVEGDDGSHFSPNSAAAAMMMMLAETLLDALW